MTDYQKLYTLLFNAVTDAVHELERENIGLAKDILRFAQAKTENAYIEMGEESNRSREKFRAYE